MQLDFKSTSEFRITEVTDEAIRVREKVLMNDEIKMVMEKYHIPINAVALIEEGEKFKDLNDTRPRYHSNIEMNRSYLYGGPKDILKVLFGSYNNGRFYVIGYVLKFPETETKKRDWKSIFQAKRKKAA
jgi:hypothetical protein